MWELEYKKRWAQKNWCFWTVVLEKTLESPLDCKKIQPVHPKGDQSWLLVGRTDVETQTPIVWPPDMKSWFIGKDPDALRKIEGRRSRGQQRIRWLDGITSSMDMVSGWTPGAGDGQGGLECCGLWGCKESDTTERLSWSDLNWSVTVNFVL